jgi:hypothetical protein
MPNLHLRATQIAEEGVRLRCEHSRCSRPRIYAGLACSAIAAAAYMMHFTNHIPFVGVRLRCACSTTSAATIAPCASRAAALPPAARTGTLRWVMRINTAMVVLRRTMMQHCNTTL